VLHSFRAAGLLLHPTSLPGPHGIGDLGPALYSFLDFVHQAGCRIWQVLPLGPTGYADSPYQCFSAFAGNPMLLSLDALVERGYLRPSELWQTAPFPEMRVDYGAVIAWKMPLLRHAAQRFFAEARETAEFDRFCARQASWLDDFARFMALKQANDLVAWTRWTRHEVHEREVQTQKFLQYEFFRQWNAVREHCRKLGILVMGDMPIYVASDSAEVWAHPEPFRLDVVAGVPPDYFSATGQLWGNPIYRWDVMAADGYQWWIRRFRAAFEMVDLLRLDHFRGFYRYWQVPASATTAIDGEWKDGPGPGLFRAVTRELGALPILAENLGVITPEVEAIREEFGFPGMRILQFAFGKDPQGPSFRPHHYDANTVAYTGTHDNDTARGWWHSTGGDSTRTPQDIEKELAFARAYLDTDGADIEWTMIRTLYQSVARTVIVPVQDVLGLGSEARMNTPGTASGNWQWRCPPGVFTAELAQRLATLARMYDR
jgi:4-alpha-glucanotransferase